MQLQNIVSIIGMVTGLSGLYIGLHEYIRQGRQKRFECYRGFQEQISARAVEFNLIGLLETDDPSLADISIQKRSEFIGLFESVSIALNSRLLSEEAVYNFFGYYTLQLDVSTHFWSGLGKDLPFWSEFNRLAKRMQRFHNKITKKIANKKSPVLTM